MDKARSPHSLDHILLTGGAGYIGSHVYYALEEQGFVPVVIDNLSTGLRSNLPDEAVFYEGDIADQALLHSILKAHPIKAVMHFAGSTNVAESIEKPDEYYQNNVEASKMLLEVLQAYKVKHFVFSSSAAVYGLPDELPVCENMEAKPISPYGENKLEFEHILEQANICSAALRYFNVAGADAQTRTGPTGKAMPHVVGAAVQHILGHSPAFQIFGDDYDTRDGSCIRDFIHVSDLADLHVHALRYLLDTGESFTMNCGYGRGVSIKELAALLKDFMPAPRIIHAQRRVGDIVESCADISKLQKMLDWVPSHDSLTEMIESEICWVRLKG